MYKLSVHSCRDNNILIGRYGMTRGASERSVRQFCSENRIRPGGPCIGDDELNNMDVTIVDGVCSVL